MFALWSARTRSVGWCAATDCVSLVGSSRGANRIGHSLRSSQAAPAANNENGRLCRRRLRRSLRRVHIVLSERTQLAEASSCDGHALIRNQLLWPQHKRLSIAAGRPLQELKCKRTVIALRNRQTSARRPKKIEVFHCVTTCFCNQTERSPLPTRLSESAFLNSAKHCARKIVRRILCVETSSRVSISVLLLFSLSDATAAVANNFDGRLIWRRRAAAQLFASLRAPHTHLHELAKISRCTICPPRGALSGRRLEARREVGQRARRAQRRQRQPQQQQQQLSRRHNYLATTKLEPLF